MPTLHKTCTKCNQSLPIDSFSQREGKNGPFRHSWCNECKRKINAGYWERNGKQYRRGQKEKAAELKRKYVEKLGGKCMRCGYNKYLAALHFHHMRDKDANVGHLLDAASKSSKDMLRRLDDEVKKCVLLCANCHAGLHAAEWEMPETIIALFT